MRTLYCSYCICWSYDREAILEHLEKEHPAEYRELIEPCIHGEPGCRECHAIKL